MALKRISFAQSGEPVDIPNLLDVQKKSYDDFFQPDTLARKRKPQGLQYIFENTFPIYDFNGDSYLEFLEYNLGFTKFTIEECRVKGMTFAVPLRAKFRLVVREREAADKEPRVVDIREEELYLGEIPMMTERGSFIINGAERVIVSQLHRSPGLVFKQTEHSSGKVLYGASIIPHRGSWLELSYDVNGVVNFSIDRTNRLPRIPVTILLRAFGYGDAGAIARLYYEVEKIPTTRRATLLRYYLAEDVKGEDDAVVARRFTPIDEAVMEAFQENRVKEVKVISNDGLDPVALLPTFRKDDESRVKTRAEALIKIYNDIRPGDLSTFETAENAFRNFFSNPRRYDLSRVGRKKLDSKLGVDFPLEDRTLHAEDVVEAVRKLAALHAAEGDVDDVDHLGNRRVRAVGELLEYRFYVGLTRMERVIRERMSILDVEECMPHDLVNAKPLTSAVKEFFGSSQLSQFLDQINPLAELTHKRRLSALGPGGLSRERANFEVRDVHYTHYGRMCPIETPEGPNIGLITSLATYGRINEFGFVETPYRRVKNGVVQEDTVWLDADEEEDCVIAQANAPVDRRGRFTSELVYARRKGGEFVLVDPKEVAYVDISPRQIVSVSTALIPFLEHDDANRALMGSNMQRQAVPLLRTEPPYVATGIEGRVARDSGVLVAARAGGVVEKVTADTVVVRPDTAEEDAAYGWFEPDVYKLKKYERTNQDTCFNQVPVVKKGEKVKAGDVLADGPATNHGELALGRNVFVAFMPWMGYNFEDAIVVSRRLAESDAFTSIHIEEFDIECRDTKLGREEITRDIPNVGSEALKNLDEHGIIRVGAEVHAGDIMVGKVVPKGETELTPEERLLRAIFAEKAGEVRDASLKAPPGMNGIVVDVKIFARKERERTDRRAEAAEKHRIGKWEKDRDEKIAQAREVCEKRLTKLLSGKSFNYHIKDELSGEVLLAKGDSVTPALLRRRLLEPVITHTVKISGVLGKNVDKVVAHYHDYVHDVTSASDKEIDRLRKGDDLPPGVLKMVKVYVARKRRLTIGDKMAGRHGNKGVVAKIVPVEDMPHMQDGTPVDIVLNPLGVPSRLNVGQIFETVLGWAAHQLGAFFESPIFEGATEEELHQYLKEAGLPPHGKVTLVDGRTGEPFSHDVTVGYLYLFKLLHLADDKIHARSVGPYSLVTQQPLGGKGQFGGQRFGEMEVWALEAYGAAYTLQELLTVKSDDVIGRARMYEAIVKGRNIPEADTPESFNVLINELRALCLDVYPEEA